MKIRESFVTNSSSSSFILAIKKDATLDDLKEAINLDAVKTFRKDFDVELLYGKTDDELLEIFGEKLSWGQSNSNMSLDDWTVSGGEIYSDCLYDEENWADALLYYSAINNTSKVRLG